MYIHVYTKYKIQKTHVYTCKYKIQNTENTRIYMYIQNTKYRKQYIHVNTKYKIQKIHVYTELYFYEISINTCKYKIQNTENHVNTTKSICKIYFNYRKTPKKTRIYNEVNL